MERPKISGIFPATFTPFEDNGDVAYDSIEPYMEFLRKNGIRGIFLNGTSGETYSLSTDERKKLLEKWMECKKEDFTVIVHVTSLCFRDAIEMAKQASELGANGISTMGAFYYKAANLDALVDNCASIAATVPDMPYYYYHIPELSGVTYPMRDFVMKGVKKIPTFCGIKFSQMDFMDFSNMAQFSRSLDGFTLFSGYDQCMLQFRTYGSHGAVGTTFNYASPIYQEIWNSYENGDFKKAEKFQELSVRMIEVLEDTDSFIAANKFVMKKCGFDVGIPRLPIKDLSEKEKQNVWDRLIERDIPKHLAKL